MFQKIASRLLGLVFVACGIASIGWCITSAERVGAGLGMGFVIFGIPLPAVPALLGGLSLCVLGLVVGFGKRQRIVQNAPAND